MYAIETNELGYQFNNDQIVLKKVNLKIPTGSIYGFLGPNGAGKTTTLRLILGLLRQQQGQILVAGKTLKENRISILRSIGSLIESPSIYGHLTAYDNLLIQQRLYQCSKQRIDTVLNIVGLAHTHKKKAGQFSLGMKQRLSIAIALLHQPSILILDEPTNGLDPNGIIEIRDLLKRINAEEKTTILISSHLLAEIEKLVSHVGIIHKGNLLFQGTLEELQTKKNVNAQIHIQTNNDKLAASFIQRNGVAAQLINNQLLLPHLADSAIALINTQLVKEDISVHRISVQQNDLESIFINLIQ